MAGGYGSAQHQYGNHSTGCRVESAFHWQKSHGISVPFHVARVSPGENAAESTTSWWYAELDHRHELESSQELEA